MKKIPPPRPSFSNDGIFIVEFQAEDDANWKVVTAPKIYSSEYHNKPYPFSDYVHAKIYADIYHAETKLPTRVNVYEKKSYIHFKSRYLDPDIWHLYKHEQSPFYNLQSAIEGCELLMRTGYITETRVSFEEDTTLPGCYYHHDTDIVSA